MNGDRCEATYGVLTCQRGFTHSTRWLHAATIDATRERVFWQNDCDATCTYDCLWCKGRLRHDLTHSTAASPAIADVPVGVGVANPKETPASSKSDPL